MSLSIQFDPHPKACDIDHITQRIQEETPDYGEIYPFAFFIREDAQDIIAAANGFVMYGAFYTDQLWVDAGFRKQGWGRALMEKVHAFGLAKGCRMATVSSMDFQAAIAFYQALGYTVDYERKGYIQGSSCLFFSKHL